MRKLISFFLTVCFTLFMLNTPCFPSCRSLAADIAPRYMKDSDGIFKKAYYSFDRSLTFAGEASATDSSATLMFTGDLMCLKGQQFAALNGQKYDFSPSFQYIRKIFDAADLRVGNLETLISSSNPLTKDRVNAANGSPQCNGPVSYLKDLRRTGFDVFVTANNHCCDWGSIGIDETLEMLDLYGFIHTGTRRSDEAVPNYVIVNVKGINVGIISTTHLINQRESLTPSQMSLMVNNFSPSTIAADIAGAKTAGAEFVVVYAHWGIENTHNLVDYQISDATVIAESGADLIIGSHPHCLQHGDEITTSDGRSVPVIYSMGNFVSSMGREINNDTIILKVGIKKSGDAVAITSYDYIPCHVLSSDLVITPVSFADESTAASWAAQKPFILPGMKQFIPSAAQRSALTSAAGRINSIFKDMKELSFDRLISN